MRKGSFAILIISLIIQLTLTIRTIPKPLPYQAHSFNDLDVAHHLMQKGVKYFKFDASLANRQSCQGYSSWKGKDCINLDEYAEDMCCIAMRGDASSQPNFYYPFNTSSEFTGLLQEFLSVHHSEIEILFIAIDFQFSFSFANKLAETFMYDLATLMNKYEKLHVTTKGDYIFEFDRVCRFVHEETDQRKNQPLLTIEGIQCTAERKHISNSRFFLQSGSMDPHDSRDYKGRFQNFNTIFRDIDRLCSSGFPTWPNKYPHFPLIFWQPSNEKQIQDSLSKLMTPQCQKKHNRTLNGIAFASNIDPEMFELMMKKTSSQFLQKSWEIDNFKVLLQNVTGVNLAKISVMVGGVAEERLVVHRKSNANNVISVLALGNNNQTVLKKQVIFQQNILQIRGVGDKIIVVRPLNGLPPTAKYSDVQIVSYDQNFDLAGRITVKDYITSSSAGDAFFFMALTTNLDVFVIYRTDGRLTKPVQHQLPVLMPHEKIQRIQRMLFVKNGSSTEFLQFLVGNDVDMTWMAEIRNGSIHSQKTLTFGTNARITATNKDSLLVLLENSYTHGGLLLNNNGQNTCIYHKVEGLKSLATIPYLIDGLEAPISDFQEFLTDVESDEIITACDPAFTFSKYINGASNDVIFIWNRIVISTKYVPLPKQNFIGALFSGGSNFEPEFRNTSGFLLMTMSQSYSPSAQLTRGQVMEEI